MAVPFIVVMASLTSAMAQSISAVSFDSKACLSDLSPQVSQEFISSKHSKLVLAISDAYQHELKRNRLTRRLLNMRHMEGLRALASPSQRSERATGVKDPGDEGSNSTGHVHLTVSQELNRFLRNSNNTDLGEVRKLLARLRAASNRGKSGQAQTSFPSSISRVLENVTNRSFPATSAAATTTISPVTASSTTSIVIGRTLPETVGSQNGMESTTSGNLRSNQSAITTERIALVTERGSLHSISVESRIRDLDLISGDNSVETVEENDVTLPPQTNSTPQPRVSSIFDLSHLNSLMEKLPPGNIEIEPIRTIVDDGVFERSATSVNEEDFWHSYTYNTGVFNRERLTVRGVSSAPASSARPLSAVFQAPVAGSLFARDADGFLVAVGAGGVIHPLRPGLGWTESSVGCPCTKASAGGKRSCACCRHGGCLCSQQDRCGPCHSAGNRPQCTETEMFLSVDAVATLPSRRNRTIVVTALFDSLSVFETDDQELSPLHLKAGQPNRLNPGVAITSLTTVDVPTRQACRVVRRSYILSHRASTGTLLAQEIVVDQQEKTYNLGVLYMWEAPGRKMKVLQTEERALVFVLKDSSVMVLELKAETTHDNFIHVLATLNVSYPVEHFHCFENLGDSYALVGGRDTAALFIIDDEEVLQSQLLQASDFGLKAFDGILPLPSGNYRGDTALLATSGNTAVILTWQQRSFVLSKSFQAPGVAWSSAAALQTRVATEVVHVAKDGRAEVISVQLSLEKERDPLSEQNERLLQLVAGIKDRLAHHNDVLKEISNRLRRSVSLGSSVTGRIRMVGGVVVKSARAHRLNLTRVTVSSTSGLEQSLEEHESLMRAEQQALLAAEARLNATELQIKGGVPQNMEVATISGHISFSSLSTIQLAASDVVMNGRILENLVKDLVDTNGFHFVSGTTTFVSPIAPHSLRATSLDGVPVTDFVSENNDVTLGRVIYQNGLTVLDEILVARNLTFGGVDLARAMTLGGRNYVDHCTFSEVDARKGLTVTDNRVNAVDIVGLRDSVLNRTLSAVVEGSLMFTNTIAIEGSVYAGTVMGVDVMNLFTTSVSKAAASTIQSSVTFKSRVDLNSSVEVVGLINGRQFPLHYPSASSKSITFENKKIEEIAVQTLSVAGLVDGIRTQDLVTLSTAQTVTGTKTFSAGIDVEGNLNISSALLDGVNLIDIQREAGKMKNEVVTYSVIFEKRTVLHSLNVTGSVNNFNITEIAGDLLLANEKVGKISGTKVFAGSLLADHITFHEINGVRSDDFVDSEGKLLVSGLKRFNKGFSCARLTVRGLTAGVNVTHLLASSLNVRKYDQVVSAKKFFTASIRASNVVIVKDVNGINFSSDVAIRTDNTSFQYEQIMSSASFKEISTLHIQLEPLKLINEVDVSSLSDSAVYSDKDQILYESITCIGEVTFKSTLKAKYVNEIELDEFIHNLVQKDEDNTIVANLQMKNVTVIGNLSTFNMEGINLFNVSKLDLNAVKLDDELLDLTAVWQNISFDGDVLFGGLINGYDLVKLQQDAVFLNSSSPLHFSGWKTMSGEVVITGNLSSPSINGLDLERDVLTKSTNQIITAPYTFKTLTTDDLDVVGTFNGMNLSELVETRLGANMFLEGPVNFSEDISVDQLEVGGLVNDVSIRGIMEDVIPMNNGSTNITGKKIFARIPRFSSLHIKRLNGEDLSALVLDLVRSDEDNHFSRDVTIVNVSAQLVVADTVTVQGHVGGVNSTELLADLIFLDQDERIPNAGTLKFANLQVGEETGQGELLVQSLNSRDTLTGYLLADWPQTFNFKGSFSSLTTGNVTGSGFVNGWDLDLFEQSLKVIGGQVLFGDLVFGNLHVTTSFNVSGNIGREVGALVSSEDVVPLNQDLISVEGCLKFESAVRARDLWSSSNVVNDIDMDDLASQAWRTDRHSFISGNFTFSGSVYFESETTLGLHGLSSLATMQREVGTIHNLVLEPIANYRGKYEEQCRKGSVLLDLLSHGFERPDHLLEVFNKSLPGHSVGPPLLVVQAQSATLVFMPQASNSCSVAVYRWSGPTIGLQQWYNIEDVGEVAEWVFLSGLPLTLVAVAVKPSVRCPGRASVILHVTADTIQATQEIKGLGNVTWDRSNSSLLLHVGRRTPTTSYSYAWNEERNTFVEVSTSPPDLVRSVSGKSHQIGWARFADGVLRVGEDSATLAEVIVQDVVDADLVYQGTDLLVLLITRQTVLDVVTFHFYVLRQSTLTGSMLVQDWLPLHSAASVSVLRRASPGEEARHLIVLAAGGSPAFFWLKGNGQLRPWALDAPSRNVSWVGHFTSEGNLYLLMQDANSRFTVSGIVATGQRLDSRRRFPVCGLIE